MVIFVDNVIFLFFRWATASLVSLLKIPCKDICVRLLFQEINTLDWIWFDLLYNFFLPTFMTTSHDHSGASVATLKNMVR